ncbi:hypothetical protein PF005_g15381 [Phytophthora fragariae]|uniref:Uncharacterized protein n=1 Tax=Phytophthora fragariae TaxID=53985 RepID=A0A6A3RR18_9STRA|nr:hypothetical protein PF003_g36995 [Phytophthora fragariae]KAE8933976.1 hypothetical protein PF009_g16028 [Phytophthora fragariae]KAE8999916.1 hypothetical protein PF011_g14417 [Phytophthora fragariae]KAE9099842.1 hypothetical protein PF010_g15036 [Phytophthora fragariae]KAE9101620.1 hypothetical protein PF007_g15073 [Phytophthora fragariae]
MRGPIDVGSPFDYRSLQSVGRAEATELSCVELSPLDRVATPLDLALKELDAMKTWCRTHVTDHSGWNHRQRALNELTKRYRDDEDVGDAAKNLVLAEFKFVSTTMAPYPTHEALWYHRRYVARHVLQQAMNDSGSIDQVPVDDKLMFREREIFSHTKPVLQSLLYPGTSRSSNN